MEMILGVVLVFQVVLAYLVGNMMKDVDKIKARLRIEDD